MGDFDSFRTTLGKLVQAFDENRLAIRDGEFDELSIRNEYIDPLFAALNWDVGNTKKVPIHEREAVVHPVAKTHDGLRRPDYVFRIGGIDKFVCEAKRPFDVISRHFFQTQNYIYNFRLWVGVLCDFENFIVFVVGGEPSKESPAPPANGWRLHYLDYEAKAEAIWDLFARDNVANGSLERFAQSQPKIVRKGKQGWLLKPDRTQSVDAKFLSYLEEQRARLAKDLHDLNDIGWNERDLNEATQRVIDRILFQRICEDRSIDAGKTLRDMLDAWDRRDRPQGELWRALVANFRHLHRTFNGGIYGRARSQPHFVDRLNLSEVWLSDFIETLTADDSTYLFGIIPVEILGSVYERFLGSVVQPDGSVVPKPEVRKAGGVYYTPKHIVDHIVEITVGKLLEGRSPKEAARLKILDPACGSGSFLLRAFERICEHYVSWFTAHPSEQQKQFCYTDVNGDLRLTTGLKRSILTNNIFGVDIDPQAVEVTQMSLYLQVLEGENTQTLQSDHRLFPSETYLPDLDDNIKFGNSLIEPSVLRGVAHTEEERIVVSPFNWAEAFPSIIKKGRGFDAVIGNPPYLNIDDTWGAGDIRLKCIKAAFPDVYNDKTDILFYFFHKGLQLSKQHVAYIVSRAFLEAFKADKLRAWIAQNSTVDQLIDFRNRHIFEGVGITTAIVHLEKPKETKRHGVVYQLLQEGAALSPLEVRLGDQTAFGKLSVKQAKFTSAPWIFAGPTAEKIFAQIDSLGESIGSVLPIGQGMQTGRNGVFGNLTAAAVADWGLRKTDYLLRARNSDIQRYEIRTSGEVVLYLEDYASFNDLPKPLQAHLRSHERELKARAAYKRGDCKWWQYTWPLHKEFYSRRRLYVPYLASANRFALDGKKEFLGLTDTTVLFEGEHQEKLEFFLALLNSRLLSWRFRYMAKLKSAGIYEYFWNNLSKLQVLRSRAGEALHDDLVALAVEMMSLTRRYSAARSDADKRSLSRQIADADQATDALVYRAYGLSPAEIATVENAVPAQSRE